jgi:glucosamine-phosphate N-acetyltransferase
MSSYLVNLIISTYAGKYNSEVKKNILKTNLKIINSLKSDITKITIMKPKIDKHHEEISEYYDFSNINLDNIKDKIVICECDNVGISYGQFFKGIENDNSYDYYIFMEDDYTPFIDYFEKEFINEYKTNDLDSLLCSFIYKDKQWDILKYAKDINEHDNNIKILKTKLEINKLKDIRCIIPDFSLCIISRYTVIKLLNRFNDFNSILNLFDIQFKNIWLHQILFGYILNASGINIYDIAKTHLNIFYHTAMHKISTCNFDNYITNWKQKTYENEKFKLPIFIPLQIIGTSRYDNDINDMKKYINDQELFTKRIKYVSRIDNFVIREIEYDDYDKGYMELMFQFSNYSYPITKDQFKQYLDTQKNKIIVIYSYSDNSIIGAGSIFKLEKIHNNPVGFIEDVIISKEYRGNNYGKLLIKKLIDIGKNEFKCYKVVLNCIDYNVGFYEKCGFTKVGFEMKIKYT